MVVYVVTRDASDDVRIARESVMALRFSSTVNLEDLESGQKVTYQIVGLDEADLKKNKVSVTSPIARALIGKYAGDVVEVQAPSGPREYEILEVRYI